MPGQASPLGYQSTNMELAVISTIQAGTQTLTRREAEVLYWIMQGKASKEIGSCLHISAFTVQKHTRNIYRKLGVRNKIEAIQQTRRLIAAFYTNPN